MHYRDNPKRGPFSVPIRGPNPMPIDIVTFPASYCNDQGRRINNAEPDWPDSLEGFAKKAHAFFEAELKPLGFRARAQILNYPDGRLGDVGLFLSW